MNRPPKRNSALTGTTRTSLAQYARLAAVGFVFFFIINSISSRCSAKGLVAHLADLPSAKHQAKAIDPLRGLPPPPSIFAPAPSPLGPNVLDYAGMPGDPIDPRVVGRWAAKYLADQLPVSASASEGTTELPNEVGLLVCDPVPSSGTSDYVAKFGVACGHWLYLTAAGQPELGRTPEWGTIGRCKRECGYTSMALTPQQTVPFNGMTGVTHVACGTISGRTTDCQLAYQVYSLPDLTPVGPPLTSTGSLAEIESTLPAMATKIDQELGVESPSVPASVNLSPIDFTWLGGELPHNNGTIAELSRLARLNSQSFLAGMPLLESDAKDDQVLFEKTVKNVLANAPDDAIVLTSIAIVGQEGIRPYAHELTALIAKYPGSALLAHVEIVQERSWGNRMDLLKTAERLVNDSPNDARAWIDMSDALGTIVNEFRDSNPGRALSPSDQADVELLNSQAISADKMATNIDPKFGRAWLSLSIDSARAGDIPSSVKAYHLAEIFDRDTVTLDVWGLLLYQRTYAGDPVALHQVAVRAASRIYATAKDVNYAVDALNFTASETGDKSYSQMAKTIVTKFMSQTRAELVQYPNSASLHLALASELSKNDDKGSLIQAIKDYRIAEHFLPNSPTIHYDLSRVLNRERDFNDEVYELRKAADLDPFMETAHYFLGYQYEHTGAFSDATRELNIAVRLQPGYSEPHEELGEVFYSESNNSKALSEFNEAIKLNPVDVAAWEGRTNALYGLQKYQESLSAGNIAVELYNIQGSGVNDSSSITETYDVMADADLFLKNWSSSISESEKALAISPADSYAAENIAEAEWDEGETALAKKQWRLVVSMGDTDSARTARGYLKEFFPYSSPHRQRAAVKQSPKAEAPPTCEDEGFCT